MSYASHWLMFLVTKTTINKVYLILSSIFLFIIRSLSALVNTYFNTKFSYTNPYLSYLFIYISSFNLQVFLMNIIIPLWKSKTILRIILIGSFNRWLNFEVVLWSITEFDGHAVSRVSLCIPYPYDVVINLHFLWVYIRHNGYLLLLISMLWYRQAIFKSKGDQLYSSAECRIWTRGPNSYKFTFLMSLYKA